MSRMNQTSDFTGSTNSDLPFDIISDILSRLPVKPLLQFKSVSKTWYALVENPHFIKKHQARSKQNLNLTLTSVLVTELKVLFKDHPRKTNEFPVHYSKTYSMWLQCRDNKTINLDPDFLFKDYPRVLGICDGLVFFTLDNSEIFICNPTTGRIRKTLGFSLAKVGEDFDIFGFWIHDNDYKLFRIVHSEVGFRAEVYSMNTDTWGELEVNTKEIDTRVRISSGFFYSIPVAINEVFYWTGHSDVPCVVSFDMNGYNFGTTNCPEEIISAYRPYWRIHDVEGELALTVCDYKWFEMWVLNEKERSWTMKLKVDDLPSIGHSMRLLGCERNGNLVMQHFTPALDIELLSYDRESHEITHLPFWGLKQRQVVYLYTESLLLV